MEAVGPRTRLRRASEAASGGTRKSQKRSQASESETEAWTTECR